MRTAMPYRKLLARACPSGDEASAVPHITHCAHAGVSNIPSIRTTSANRSLFRMLGLGSTFRFGWNMLALMSDHKMRIVVHPGLAPHHEEQDRREKQLLKLQVHENRANEADLGQGNRHQQKRLYPRGHWNVPNCECKQRHQQ